MKTKFIAITLVLVLALVVAVPTHAQTAPAQVTIDIFRTAVIGQWGIVHIMDNFTVHNNGTTPATYLDFGVPTMFKGDVYYVDAKDSHGKTLAVDANVNQTSNFYWMRVHFANELPFNSTYRFVVDSIVAHIITTAATGLLYNFTAAPVLTQDAREANVTLLGAVGSNFAVAQNSTYTQTTVAGQPALVKQYKPWKAYSTETFVGPYLTVSQYLVDVTSAERDIKIGSSGALSILDTYNLHNYAIPVSSITITLPDGATNVMAYDIVGAMWSSPQDPGAPYQVSIAPRYGEGIRGGENFTFSISYDLPQSEYLKQVNWWGNYNLTLPMVNNREDFVFDTATVKIIAPSGVRIDNVMLPPSSPISPPTQYDPAKRQIQLQGVTTSSNVTLGVFFRYIPFWAASEFLPWLLGLEVAFAAVVLTVRVRRGPQLAIPVPVEKLREFVGLYDERISLSRELVAMEEEVARGGMVKHEFRRRTKVMELRLDEINKSLMVVKAEIREISQHYDELIRRIDRAEAEIHVSRGSLNQVRAQYRSGKSTRETYDAMVNDLTKRIDRAEQTVETILITLREEAR
ncbi:MAG TPA: hypothetical protein VEC43_01120 [Candidatus Acidoferrales bacterium]|nr:hypothetical protein [Candidatus Acidoferrales bacterium]